MAALTSYSPPSILVSLRLQQYRRITLRHVLLTLTMSAVLCTLYYTYLGGNPVFISTEEVLSWPTETPEIWAGRAARVKEAFQHAYHGYEQHAFPHDELLPVSNSGVDNFNGWGVTVVDSLDTMLLMGLEDEYTRALPIVKHANFSLPTNTWVPFFETAIRYLGGLLGAYAISGHDLLREKADELATKLAPVFNTTSGFPGYAVNTYEGTSYPFVRGVLAEIATFQMEYTYLGKITGKKEHVDHAILVTNLLYNATLNLSGGMYPTYWDLDLGTPSGPRTKTGKPKISVGALADSAHEYTLKQFLLTARRDKRNLEMYLRFTSYVINNMLYLTPDRHLLYVTDATVAKRMAQPSHLFEHLSCFFPGLLALGVHLLPLDRLDTLGIDVAALADDLFPNDRRDFADLFKYNLADLHLWAAKGIAQTCYLTYADQPTGLGPEMMRMYTDPLEGGIRWMDAMHSWQEGREGLFGWWGRRPKWAGGSGRSASEHLPPGVRDIKPWVSPLPENATIEAMMARPTRGKGKALDTFGRDYLIKNAGYFLRPETVESLYILWQTTKDDKWRHRGWDIFQAIERHARTDSGYTNVDGVNANYPKPLDSMPSYFLAETLKYLYLLFSGEDPLPLENWVYNTEAHAFPVFEWTREEREAYGIV